MRYTVRYNTTAFWTADVEADSPEQARDLAIQRGPQVCAVEPTLADGLDDLEIYDESGERVLRDPTVS